MSQTARIREDAAHPTLEKERLEHTLNEALASALLEGGGVTPGAEAIMRECAQGVIDNQTAIARIKALHGVRV